MGLNIQSKKIREVTLEELTTPKPNHDMLTNRWWVTRNGNPIGLCLVPNARPDGVYGYHYPMANPNKAIAEKICKVEPPIFVPVAFWPRHPSMNENRPVRYHSGDLEYELDA